MKEILLVMILILGYPTLMADNSIPDPEAWYSQGYGPLWSGRPAEHIEQILTYYADEVETRSVDGQIRRKDKQTWLATPMAEWAKQGWTSSDLSGLKTDRINATTAVFKSSWLDHYSNAPDETSCGWYLADFLDGRWQFTVYAEIDCAEHGSEIH